MIVLLILGILSIVLTGALIYTAIVDEDFDVFPFILLSLILNAFTLVPSFSYYFNSKDYIVYTVVEERASIDSIEIEREYFYLREGDSYIKTELKNNEVEIKKGDTISLTDKEFEEIFYKVQTFKVEK